MAVSALDLGLGALALSRRTLLSLLEDVPPDKLCHQPIPGGNHALWIAGHLAGTDDFFLNAVAGQPPKLPPHHKELFGMGSKPTPDPRAYPPFEEIKNRLGERREALVSWLKSLNPRKLDEPLPENLKMFASSHAALPASMAWHEGLHSGQLTVIRRSLGIGPKFG